MRYTNIHHIFHSLLSEFYKIQWSKSHYSMKWNETSKWCYIKIIRKKKLCIDKLHRVWRLPLFWIMYQMISTKIYSKLNPTKEYEFTLCKRKMKIFFIFSWLNGSVLYKFLYLVEFTFVQFTLLITWTMNTRLYDCLYKLGYWFLYQFW